MPKITFITIKGNSVNKIIEQELVPKDEAWYFCNQLFWALRNESIDNYIQRLKSANTLRPTTMTVGENRSLSANAEYQRKQEEGNKIFNSHKSNKQ